MEGGVVNSNVKNRAIFNEFKEHAYNFVSYDDCEKQASLKNHDVQVQVKACAYSAENFQIPTELFQKKPKVLLPASTSFSGIVKNVGPSVTKLKAGDRVAGVLPLDSDSSACSYSCTVNEFNLVILPESVDFDSAAACIGDGVKAYTALHYLGRLEAGETVMIMDAATGFGSLAVQLAHIWGAKVLAVVGNGQERSYLHKLEPPPSCIIEVDSKSATLVGSVMEETGKMGVDVIVDSGVKQFETVEENDHSSDNFRVLPKIHDVISCLAVGGRWVTSQPDLQLDPPISLQLFLRSASVCFLFEQSWMMSASRQGRWQHIVHDIIKQLQSGSIKPHITSTIPFDRALQSLQNIEQRAFGKTVIRMT